MHIVYGRMFNKINNLRALIPKIVTAAMCVRRARESLACFAEVLSCHSRAVICSERTYQNPVWYFISKFLVLLKELH